MVTEINPMNYSLKLDGKELIPVMCDMHATADTLLNIIRNNCKTVCSGIMSCYILLQTGFIWTTEKWWGLLCNKGVTFLSSYYCTFFWM